MKLQYHRSKYQLILHFIQPKSNITAHTTNHHQNVTQDIQRGSHRRCCNQNTNGLVLANMTFEVDTHKKLCCTHQYSHHQGDKYQTKNAKNHRSKSRRDSIQRALNINKRTTMFLIRLYQPQIIIKKKHRMYRRGSHRRYQNTNGYQHNFSSSLSTSHPLAAGR